MLTFKASHDSCQVFVVRIPNPENWSFLLISFYNVKDRAYSQTSIKNINISVCFQCHFVLEPADFLIQYWKNFFHIFLVTKVKNLFQQMSWPMFAFSSLFVRAKSFRQLRYSQVYIMLNLVFLSTWHCARKNGAFE